MIFEPIWFGDERPVEYLNDDPKQPSLKKPQDTLAAR